MIEKITIKIDEKLIDLTKDQALELRKDLNEIFEEPALIPCVPYRPVTYPGIDLNPPWQLQQTWC